MNKKPELSSNALLFVKQLNKYPRLFNETPVHMFQPSVRWPMFHGIVKKPFVIYVCKPGLIGIPFHIERSEPLALGYLHFLHTSSLHVGYVFEVDFSDKQVYNTHYFLAHKKEVDFKNSKIKPEVPLTNQDITVYSYAEDMVLAIRKAFVFPITKP